MRQPDHESPTVFGLRVEMQCDRLDGLFHAQVVKGVFINVFSEIIQFHVRVLDTGQIPSLSPNTYLCHISSVPSSWITMSKPSSPA